jgi:hypothetical protein
LKKLAFYNILTCNWNDDNTPKINCLGSNEGLIKSCGFKSKKSQKNSTNKHNSPSAIVVLDENKKQRLKYSLIQMDIRDNELLF